MSLNEKLIDYPTDFNSFIGGWYMPHYICDDILKFMDVNKNKFTQGLSLEGDDKNHKDSMDLYMPPQYKEYPFDGYRYYLQKCLEEYMKRYPEVDHNFKFDIYESYNLQKYPPGGGFKRWHFENSMGPETYQRVLVFMTYLNDVPDGGTAFKFQNLNTKAEKGLTLIWPTIWTHTHKGIISTTSEKQIVTGWYHSLCLYDDYKENNTNTGHQ
tara:strand:- start:57 stop:692 length:636 start_codon:yes stop_codon:yes gene_type:complete